MCINDSYLLSQIDQSVDVTGHELLIFMDAFYAYN